MLIEFSIDKQTMVNYLHSWMEYILPEDLGFEKAQKDVKESQQGSDKSDYSIPKNFMHMKKEPSCRQRVLSVINEEVESSEE